MNGFDVKFSHIKHVCSSRAAFKGFQCISLKFCIWLHFEESNSSDIKRILGQWEENHAAQVCFTFEGASKNSIYKTPQ